MLWYQDASLQVEESRRAAAFPGAALPRPRSIEEVLAIAHAMEREAATRYGDLAGCMRLVGRADLAQLFNDLATAEQAHVTAVEQMAMQSLRRMPDLTTAFQWRLPETFGSSNRSVVTNMLTPYEALVTAVHNEGRALAFWVSVAAEAEDPAVRAQAEGMARQELLHAAALRIARRRAYRAGGRLFTRAHAATLDERTAEIADLRCRAARSLKDASVRSAQVGDHMTSVLLEFACEEIAPTNEPEPPMRGSAEGTRADTLVLLFDATGQMEQLAEAASDCLDAHPEVSSRRELRRLARTAALQVSMLNRRLCELEPSLLALAMPADRGDHR